MSAKFNNMFMTGGTLNFAEGDIHINSSDKSETDKGIDRLFSNIAPGAFHDSGERFDAPKCHPNTRAAVIQEILDWLDDQESSELVMWLHGAAGAGKSAIAQTIAQILFDQGRLSGSFFFSRGSTSGRNDERRLVSTLAYQQDPGICCHMFDPYAYGNGTKNWPMSDPYAYEKAKIWPKVLSILST